MHTAQIFGQIFGACMGNWVCLSVSLSVRWKILNKDIVKQFPKLTVALIKVTYVYLIGSKVVLYTLCFSSCFLFNVLIIRHFNTLDMVESRYSLTQHVSIIRWSLGIICWLWSIPWIQVSHDRSGCVLRLLVCKTLIPPSIGHTFTSCTGRNGSYFFASYKQLLSEALYVAIRLVQGSLNWQTLM